MTNDEANFGPLPSLLSLGKYEAMRTLLEELRNARPLLLYGDAWIARINEVLGMPDDKPDES